MALIVGTKAYVGGTSPVLPLPDTTNRGSMLYNDGTNGFWAYPGNPANTVGTGFEFRSIFTHGYLAGGYKGYNPWRSVNKTWHATDITTYCGEQLEYSSAYHEGTFSDYNGYIAGCQGDTYSGANYATVSNRTVSINLHNGNGRSRGTDTYSPYTTFGFGSGQNEAGGTYSQGTGDATVPAATVGGWNGNVAKLYTGCATNMIGQVGYDVCGNDSAGTAQSNTNKLHFGTEIMYAGPAAPTAGPSGGCGGQLNGYFSLNAVRYRLTFSTDTFAAITTAAGTSWSYKWMPTKKGYIYGNEGTNYVKFSESTFTDVTTFAKIFANSEENYEMGQEVGYMLGGFNSSQNNYSCKFTYATNALTSMGQATRPKGHFGQSSAACFSAAAAITSPYLV